MAIRPRRNRRIYLIVGAVVIILVLASSARFYTDVLWFREVGITSVLWTSIGAQALLGLVVGLGTAVLIYFNLLIAARVIPTYAPAFRIDDRRVDPLERYRELLLPRMRWIRVVVALFLGFLAGSGASSSWQAFVLFLNRVSFGVDDPQFGRDVGFYVFQLPFYELVLSWLWFAVLASLIVSLIAHYFYGSIRPEVGLRGITSGALAHGSVLLGVLALIKAGQYWLGQFQLNFSPRGVVTGASYTDVHAQLPALRLLAIISVISAILFLVNIRFRRISLPLAAVAIWILTAVLAGGVWPWWVQRFSVEPQEAQRESPFIARNLDATRAAFGLDDVSSVSFAASQDLTPSDLEANQVLLQNVRVWDPLILRQAYSQLQAIRTYYQFVDVDIDRYEVDGETRQVLLAPRELSIDDLRPQSRTWSNEHLQYTHGYGIVASLANESTTAGQPQFLVSDVPGTVSAEAPGLELTQPGIYYGEGFGDDEYSVVNSQQEELDYPTEDEGVTRSSYAGEGGVELGGFINQVAFALREQDPNLVLSSLITGESRVMIYKNVRARVLRAAPFLRLDHDPYMVAADGRLKWILDAYTTTSFYPYSERFDLGVTIGATEVGALQGQASYIRNSVKVVVDAYDGTMDFYIIEPDDPLIQAWARVFPDLFTDDPVPDEIEAHFRYPEDLFKIQSEVFLTYHMTDPLDFYSKEDEWEVADTGEGEGFKMDPTYLLFSLPDSPDEEFILTRPFTPRARDNMIAIMAARSDPGVYGELLTLDLPSGRTVAGPAQIHRLINQDEAISQSITLLSQAGSQVLFGSLLPLPIDDSILYVQPMLVTADTGTGTSGGIPELNRVILGYGEQVVQGDNFSDALAELFGEAPPVAGEPTPPPDGGEEPGGEPGEEPAPGSELAQLIERAGQLYEDAQAALQEGDFEEYGRLIEELGQVISEAEQASGS